MNFDHEIDRTGTNSLKWDFREEYLGRDDVLPIWVADSDWKTAKPILKSIKKRIDHGILGYTKAGKKHDEAVVNWVKRKYGWNINSKWIVYTSGIVPSLSVSVRAFTNSGDGVLIQTPVYYPFFSVIKNNGAHIVNNQLIYDRSNNEYDINFEDLKSKLEPDQNLIGTKSRVKMMILCNPHNPVGKVWSKKKLRKIGKMALENDVLVVSDEIHSDIIFNGEHTPFSSISDKIAENSITMISPSKTFNIAGLHIGIAIIPNPRIRKIFEENREHLLKEGNVLGLTALKSAYKHGNEWLNKQISYLQGNRDFATEYVKKNIPKVEPIQPEGTFLLWLDFHDFDVESEKLNEFVVEEAGVGLDDGLWFGPGGKDFLRLNFACPRSTLEKGLKSIEEAIKKKYSSVDPSFLES